MSRKRHTAEEIVAKLRQVEVLTAQGRPVAEAVRAIGVTEGAPGRAAQRRNLLLAPRGTGDYRELEASLQHHPAALVAGLPATCPRGRAVAGCAIPTSSAGHPSSRA